ncbi:MAG: protein kinase [Myxococcales bacterium]|nr:protein kinase [Myxococcales bacterium]
MLAHGTSTPQRRDRLIREARAQARIQHANVCHIYYIGESEGLLFFAMELVTGATFAERIAQGAVAPELALELVRKAALGLREANRCGFTHRDVKPSNLMIDQHGEVKVMDFGLVAGSPEHGEDGAGSIEQTSLAGTPLYMAPEQARGEPIDLRADIYALGATLFHLVAGKPPFAGDNAAELLHQHSSAARPALVRHDLSARDLASVQGLCERMMAKHPADRHASYDELIRDLELLSSLHSPPAGATVRITAAVVDLLVCVPALIAVSWISSDLDGVVSFTLIFGLVRVLLLSWLGRSLGHAVFELEVVNMKDGQRPALRQAAARGLWQLGLPLVAIALWGLSMLGVPRMSTISNVGAIAAYGFLCAHLYFASIRRAKRRTFWDRRSHTMVRYRRR